MGSTLRVRSRKFPAIVNCTSIDWFHEWPEEALYSVSYRFLLQAESELLTVNKIAKHLKSSNVKNVDLYSSLSYASQSATSCHMSTEVSMK